MLTGLEIRALREDDDHLEIDIVASNDRFSGSARIFVDFTKLSEFANALEGFPSSAEDRRSYTFGARGYAGGLVQLDFHGRKRGLGPSAFTVAIEDDGKFHATASATFSVGFEPAALDRFLASVRDLERTRVGKAILVRA